jgi:hypothetical protein
MAIVDLEGELKERILDVRRRDRNFANRGMDGKELAEREEAAQAYAGESERHFVDYLADCTRQSEEENKDIRAAWAECWDLFCEKEPRNYAYKEGWQQRIIVPRPRDAVLYGAANIKKAFSPDFLTIEDEGSDAASAFWKKTMNVELDDSHANFIECFEDASKMSLAVGLSQELIPVYKPGKGLSFQLVEPWKILRDPDAPPKDPHGGMYWIHREWIDWYVLKEMEKSGVYRNVDACADVNENEDDPFLTKEAIKRRKDQIYNRSAYRKMILASEFYGTVLDPKGNMLLPTATFTVAGGRVISLPKVPPYRRHRWPGVSFSPLPHMLRHGGDGLLKSVKSIWEAMCNIMCLHVDGLNWLVNPPTEINVDALVDAEDVEDWPGKKYLVRDTVAGQQAIRPVTRKQDVTNAILANMQYMDQLFQRGTMVTDSIQGLPGWRQDMTWRESEMLLQQSLGVYGLMGSSIESGARAALNLAQDVIESNATVDDYYRVLGDEFFAENGIALEQGEEEVFGLPALTGRFHVSGMEALMKDNETLKSIKELLEMSGANQEVGSYTQTFNLLKAWEKRVKLTDENLLVPDAIGKQLQLRKILTLVGPEVGLGADPSTGGVVAGGDGAVSVEVPPGGNETGVVGI